MTTEAAPNRHADLAAVAQQFGLADIYVFGSRAREISGHQSGAGVIAHSGSDVDIAVRPLPGRVLSPADRVELTIALERSLGVTMVDLLILPEADAFLALAAIRGELLYCSDTVDQAEYELYVLRRAGDLLPLELERQRIVLGGGR